MKLLVTGGAGYVGGVVAAQLIEAGHAVTVLDSLITGHVDAVPEGARFVRADVLDRARLGEILAEGYDGVLHFAALIVVPESVLYPERYERAIIVGTLNLLDAMRAARVPRLIFSSSAAVYGHPDAVPIPETAPTRPTSPYGFAKLAVDQMLTFEVAAHGLAAVSLRYFNVAGASGPRGEDHRPETHLIPQLLAVAAGRAAAGRVCGTDYPTPDGTGIRDYVHVEDLAGAHLLALGAARPGRHEIYNLGNGRGFSVREVVEAARRVTGHPIPTVEEPRRAGDASVLVASSAKIREELGWAPRKPTLDAMIGDAWAWLAAHPRGYGGREGP
jgi:UDP-glucose 4-epimerase